MFTLLIRLKVKRILFLVFLLSFCIIMLEGKFLMEGSPEQYSKLENFATSAI